MRHFDDRVDKLRMAMSNADRQRRYRQKLKARASGGALGDRVRDAVERAVAALWAFHERPAPGGIRWSDIDGCTSLDMYRAELRRGTGNLLQACRAFLPEFEGLGDEETRAIATVIDMADALRLVHNPVVSNAAHGSSGGPAADL